MRITVLQMKPAPGDVAGNLARIDAAAAEARAGGADVLVAPELAVPGYGAGDALRDLAESTDGAQVSALRESARRHAIAIIAGFAERGGGRTYNTAAAIDASGRASFYRKQFLYGAYERAIFTPGAASATIIDIAGMRAGVLICYDVEFPECVRALARAGVDAVLAPTALPQGGDSAFIAERVVPVRAFENQIAIAYANYAGSDPRFAYAGRSCIAMPDGSDAARAPETEPALIFADYVSSDYANSRAENAYLADLAKRG
jgi:predicted amidohydrolase